MSIRICDLDDSLREAARLLLDEDSECLLVRADDEPDRISGVITMRDVRMAVQRHGMGAARLRVRDVLSGVDQDAVGRRIAIVSLAPPKPASRSVLAIEEGSE